jgi:RNA 3'-terminal phosphate cyclase (ATP)
MIEIDGSYGEGGGQILRTALSLSCLTGYPVMLYDIRVRKDPPGLKPQHLMCARAAAEITGGDIEGDKPGSTELSLRPGPLKADRFVFDIAASVSSAGSTSLVFQTIAPPLAFARKGSRSVIKGGTHVEWSPPADYIKDVFLPVVAPMGVTIDLQNPMNGYYPTGGGEISAEIVPVKAPLKPLNITSRGALKAVSVASVVSNLPLRVAQRQVDMALERLNGLTVRASGSCHEAPSPGRGSHLFILAEFENIRAGFSSLGAHGKKAEAVVDEACNAFSAYLQGNGAADTHLADQAALWMALAEGESALTVARVTEHLRTNAHVIEKFLPVKFAIEGSIGEEGVVKVTGAAFRPR